MSKLKQHLDESRNIKGDVGKVMKTVKKYWKERDKITRKVFEDIEKLIISVAKATDEDSFNNFVRDIQFNIDLVEDENIPWHKIEDIIQRVERKL